MAQSAAKRFRAVLEPLQGGLGWVVARVPFDVEEDMEEDGAAAGEGGDRRGGFSHIAVSVCRSDGSGGHFVLVNKKMQKAAGAGVGAMVDFTIAPDLEERDAARSLRSLQKLLKTQKSAGEVVRGAERADTAGDRQVDRWREERGGPAAARGADGGTAAADDGGGEGAAAGA